MQTRPPAQGTDASGPQPGAGSGALDRLFAVVYDDLRRVAHGRLLGERADMTLATTALVNETYLKLVQQRRVDWSDRAQFFALAAQAMRRILVDYARRHRAEKRGGAAAQVPVADLLGSADRCAGPDAQMLAAQRSEDLLALDEALRDLAALDDRLSRVVECRFFAGYTEEETAGVLGVTARTVARDWVKAKAWLYHRLRG